MTATAAECAAEEPLRVLMATTSFPRWEGDPAGHFVAELAGELVHLGHRVSVVAPHAPGSRLDEDVDGVFVRRFRYLPDSWERVAYGDGIPVNLRRDARAWLGLPSFWGALRRAVREFAADADIVHHHWGPTVVLAGSWGLRSPAVVTLHGSDVTMARHGGPGLAMLRSALGRVRGVIAVSAEQAAFLEEEHLWDDDRFLRIIPSAVPEELLSRPRPRRGRGRPFTFAFVGRLNERKGVLDLLEAFARLEGDERLVFAGDGPVRAGLERRAGELGLGGRVAFEGALEHDHALEAIASADALALPSYGEGSPLSVIEALALGTPVVASRVGGIPDLVADDERLVTPGDVGGLAEAMRRLASSPAASRRATLQTRRAAAGRLTWPATATATVALYRDVVECHALGVRR